ncbi:MAG: hypothetical protein NC183_07100, partial [Corallococcus sp.]|nr:hypothetical protein [Corallococcus sp.]
VLDAMNTDDVSKLDNEADKIAQAGQLGAITIATNMAGRGTDIILGGNYEYAAKRDLKTAGYNIADINKAIEKHDLGITDLTDKEREIISTYAQKCDAYKKDFDRYKQDVVNLGGLCVIGTERHDARRIDNQLRGRAGRQGDPGCSVFFISAEDEMIKVFGGAQLQRLLTFLGADDQPINSRMVSKIIESAQKRVEGMHFSGRKNVLQYDDVNNRQRKVIYGERKRILEGGDIHEEILKMTYEYARFSLERASGGEENSSKWDFDGIFTVDDLTAVMQSRLNGAVNGSVDLRGVTARDVLDNPFEGRLKNVLKDSAEVRGAFLEEMAQSLYEAPMRDLNGDEKRRVTEIHANQYDKNFDNWYKTFVSVLLRDHWTHYAMARENNCFNRRLRGFFDFDKLVEPQDAESGESVKAALVNKTLRFVDKYDLNKELSTLVALYVRNSLNVALEGSVVIGPKYDVNKRIYKFFDFLQKDGNDVIINQKQLPSVDGETFRFQYQLELERKVTEYLKGVDNVREKIVGFIDRYVDYILNDRVSTSITRGNVDVLNNEIEPYFGFIVMLRPNEVDDAKTLCQNLADKCKEKLNSLYGGAEKYDGAIPFDETERIALLQTIDRLWMEHVDALDDLRQGVGLQAIGQHDPLMVYKKESYDMFEELNDTIARSTIRLLLFGRFVRNRRVEQKPLSFKEKPSKSLSKEKNTAANDKQDKYKYVQLDRKLEKLSARTKVLRDTMDKLKPMYNPEELAVTLEKLYKDKYACEAGGDKGDGYVRICEAIKTTEDRLTRFNQREMIVTEIEKELYDMTNRQDRDDVDAEMQLLKPLTDKVDQAEKDVEALRQSSKK